MKFSNKEYCVDHCVCISSEASLDFTNKALNILLEMSPRVFKWAGLMKPNDVTSFENRKTQCPKKFQKKFSIIDPIMIANNSLNILGVLK